MRKTIDPTIVAPDLLGRDVCGRRARDFSLGDGDFGGSAAGPCAAHRLGPHQSLWQGFLRHPGWDWRPLLQHGGLWRVQRSGQAPRGRITPANHTLEIRD